MYMFAQFFGAEKVAASVTETSETKKFSFSLKNIFKQKQPEGSVEIVVVNESIYFGTAKTVGEDDIVTVIYDRSSLDSLYALSWFRFLYGEMVQAVPYNGFTGTDGRLKASKETIVVGVEIPESDLHFFNNLTENLRIYAYRDSFGYLYNKKKQTNFKNVTLYQCDNDYNIGGKNISEIENSMAMMLKIHYFYSNEWSLWPQHKFAVSVAHHMCFYTNVPAYNLTKSIYEIHRVKDQHTKTMTTISEIHNRIETLMWDLKNKLESCDNVNDRSMSYLMPELNVQAHKVYKERLLAHINETRVLQGWRKKGSITGGNYYAYCIPAMEFTIKDIMALSSINVQTTMCIRDVGSSVIYYIYSKTSTASKIAELLKGDYSWMQGNIICVSKKKGPHDRH